MFTFSTLVKQDVELVTYSSDNHDIANARIEFDNGCVCNLTEIVFLFI